MSLADVDAIVLAGGLGTRLAGVLPEGTPKFLCPFGPKREPFAGYYLEHLYRQGFRRVILMTAQHGDAISHWLDFATMPLNASRLDVVEIAEPAPVGTASAVRVALQHVGTDVWAVLNGDTLWNFDLQLMMARWPAAVIRSAFSLVEGRPVFAGVHLIRGRPGELLAAEGPTSFDDRVTSIPEQFRCGYLSGYGFFDIGTPAELSAARAEWFGGAVCDHHEDAVPNIARGWRDRLTRLVRGA